METGELPLDEPSKKKKGRVAFTTPQVEKLIAARWSEAGEHVVMFDCPNQVGMKQKRRCDVVAVSMWQKSGYLINGMEIKVSRSDWLRELKQTSKADIFLNQCDRWWLVTGHVDVALPEEIPDCWGWMNATEHGLRILRPAKVLDSTLSKEIMRRDWAYALIQRAARQATKDTPEFTAQVEERVAFERKHLEEHFARLAKDPWADRYAEIKLRLDTFQKVSGIELDSWRWGSIKETAELAKALHDLNVNSYNGAATKFRQHISAYQDLIKRTEAALAALNTHPPKEPTGEDFNG